MNSYLEETFVPLDVVPDIEEVDVCQTPFYEMMQQKAATKIQKVVQMIEIAEMTGDAASILKSGKGSSMLMLHRLLVATDGKPLAYTRLMGDGKKYNAADGNDPVRIRKINYGREVFVWVSSAAPMSS